MKKFVSVMLVLCMVLALVPAMAFAAGNTVATVGEQPFDDIQKAVDAAVAGTYGTNRVDVVADIPACTIQVSGKIVIQLNGHTLTAKSGTYGKLPVNIIGAAAELTIQGPGKITAQQYSTEPVIANGGKLTLEQEVVIFGVIVNDGTVNVTKATVAGTFDNTGVVNVSDGTFTKNPSYYFFNGGEVNISGGKFTGKLHDHGKDTVKLTITGGTFDDPDVINHTTEPVAGWAAALVITKDSHGNMTNPMTPDFTEFWVGKATMEANAKAKKAGNVVFLYGDVSLSGVPVNYGSDPYPIYYFDAWKSWHPGPTSPAYTGRGLVNGLSDFNVTVAKAKIDTTADQLAVGVLQNNADAVTKVEAVYTGTLNNEVFVDINIYADMNMIQTTKIPEKLANFGNYGQTHKWIPLSIGFVDLNYTSCFSDAGARDNWFSIFKYGGLVKDSNHYFTWVGLDHLQLGDNATLDFCDYETGLVYRCTLKLNPVTVDNKPVYEPDDKENAETYPGEGKPGNASSTKPAGTGEGDGPAKTGDNSTVMLWATLLVASAAGVAICVVDEAKKRSRK